MTHYTRAQHDALCATIERTPFEWHRGAPAGGSYYAHDALLHGRWVVERQDGSWNVSLNGVFIVQRAWLVSAKLSAAQVRKNKLLHLLDIAVRDGQEIAVHVLTR